MGELAPKDILVFSFKSLGTAYQAAQCLNSADEIMEIFPLGKEGHAIFFSDRNLAVLFEQIQNEFAGHIVSSHFLPRCSAQVLRAYLSVENAEIEQGLLILEDRSLGCLMQAASQALLAQLKIMDLRLLRGTSSSAYLFLTGDKSALAAFQTSLPSELQRTFIAEPSEKTRDFFSLKP